jgi:lysozyme
MTMTDEQCNDRLYVRLENDFHKPLTRCISGFDAAPLSWQAAMLDLSYNVGVGAACKSTAARRARAKDFRGSCHAMTWFNRAGGRVVEGLKRRREMGDASRIGELEICLEGLG